MAIFVFFPHRKQNIMVQACFLIQQSRKIKGANTHGVFRSAQRQSFFWWLYGSLFSNF